MINSQNLITKICDKINLGGLTSLQTCQTDNALTILNSPVKCVASFADLPSAADYAGRMIYVGDENRYYAAFGNAWTNNFGSEVVGYADFTYAWGCNGSGRLGDDSTITRSSPVSVVSFSNWCQISAGVSHSLGVRCNGTAWAWGDNKYGQFGDNSTISRSSPVSVVGGFTDWCQLSGGGFGHSLGVRVNGTAWAWGYNGRGNLGDNTSISRSSPVSVVGGFTDWCQVSAGWSKSFGIRTNGTLWAWGCNGSGQLGDNCTIDRSSPVSVVGGFTDWRQVSSTQCSFSSTLGLRSDGTIWSWGPNSFGQLGDNTTISRSSPVSVVGGFTDWCQVSAGGIHGIGLRTDGTAWAWGFNGSGRLGDNCTINRSSPVSVVGGFTNWCQVSAGLEHNIGVRTNGTAWAWGCNSLGRLGDNSTINRSSPVSVVGGFTDWSQVSAGYTHSMAILQKFKGC